MALSSLQAQLAALNNGSAAPTASSSRRHEDAIGRGIAYSVQHGASSSHNSNKKRQASILYETATDAADIPLSTIRENYIQAIEFLSSSSNNDRTSPFSLLYDMSLILLSSSSSTTGTTTTSEQHQQNDKDTVPTAIRTTLAMVGSILAQQHQSQQESQKDDTTNNEDTMACLQILEYLIRQYTIHVDYSVDLLWVFLPVADVYPKLTHRCLLLCDWTVNQSYLWLRPYCIEQQSQTQQSQQSSKKNNKHKSTTTALNPSIPSRHVIATHMMKHMDILRTVCSMVRTMYTLHQSEQQQQQESRNNDDDDDMEEDEESRDSSGGLPIRSGIASIVSYTAALILEGLVWVQRHFNDSYTSTREDILRILLPTIAFTIEQQQTTTTTYNNNNDFVSWGYIVASSIAETMPLSIEIQSLLCTKIIMASSASWAERRGTTTIDNTNTTTIALVADAITCVLSIVLSSHQPQQQQHEVDDIDDENNDTINSYCYLPILGGGSTNYNDKTTNTTKCLGCLLTTDMYNALLRGSTTTQSLLPSVLGHLYHDRNVIIAPFMGAYIAKTIQSWWKQSNSSKNNNNKGTKSAADGIVKMIQHEDLREQWEDPVCDLIASVAAFLLQQYYNRLAITGQRHGGDGSNSNNHSIFLENARRVLTALHRLNPVKTEWGIARGLEELVSTTSTSSNGIEYATFVAALLDDIVVLKKLDDHHRSGTTMMDQLFPPRVALEHTDALVRLQAVEQLMQSCNRIDESLLDSLISHGISDPNVAVAKTTCRALIQWLERRDAVEFTVASAARYMERILVATCDSIMNRRLDDDDEVEELHIRLTLVAHMAREVARLGQTDLLIWWQYSVELLAMMTGSSNDALAEHAATLVLVAFDQTVQDVTNESSNMTTARQLLCGSKAFLKGLQQPESRSERYEVKNPIVKTVWRSCMVVVLGDLVKSIDQAEPTEKTDVVNTVKAMSLSVLEYASSIELTAKECNIVRRCLLTCCVGEYRTTTDDRIPSIIISLATTESNKSWTSISVPIIKAIAGDCNDRQNRRVSPFTVLFEAALRPTSTNLVVKRLLSPVKMFLMDDEGCIAPWLCIVPLLSLLEHEDQSIREIAANLLGEVGTRLPGTNTSEKSSMDWSCLKNVCRDVSHTKTLSRMGGAEFLSSFLALSCKKRSKDQAIQNALLTLCVFSAASIGVGIDLKDDDTVIHHGWLAPSEVHGGCRATAILITAMEVAGDEAFPLQLRWNLAGRRLLSMFLSDSVDSCCMSVDLAKCVIRMIKGAIVTDPSMVISTGPHPGSGGRMRSYSIGRMEGMTFISPYPDEMTEALIGVVSKCASNTGASVLATFAFRDIFQCKGWCEFVFKSLSVSYRNRLCCAILVCLNTNSRQCPDDLFSDLPLTVSDIVMLLGSNENDVNLSNDSVVLDFVFGNMESLCDDPDSSALVKLLFTRLKTYGAMHGTSGERPEFVIQSVLLTLGKALDLMSKLKRVPCWDGNTLAAWTDDLLVLLGANTPPNIKPLLIGRSRSAALAVLAELCTHFPQDVVPSLIPATMSVFNVSDNERNMMRVATNTFSSIVPVFASHAMSARHKLSHLLHPFIESVTKLRKDPREAICFDFARSLTKCEFSDSTFGSVHGCVGALQAFYIANEARQHRGESLSGDTVGFVVGLLQCLSSIEQANCLLLLLGYAAGMLSELQEAIGEASDSDNGLLPGAIDICFLAVRGSLESNPSLEKRRKTMAANHGRSALRTAIEGFLRVFSDGLMLESIRVCISQGDDAVVGLSFRVLQVLLTIQSMSQVVVKTGFEDDEHVEFQRNISSLVKESRELLQSFLPSHIFFASAASLVTQVGATDMRAQAVQLVTDRAVSVSPDAPEATLLVDILPNLVDILKNASVPQVESNQDLLLISSVLVAIEQIARSLVVPDALAKKRYGVSSFLDALQSCCQFLLACEVQVQQDNRILGHVGDLLSATALCCSTLIRTIGVPCLPILPKLVKVLVAVLRFAISTDLPKSAGSNAEQLAPVRVVQLSIARALLAITETVPQCLTIYLSTLLSGSALLSPSLRRTQSHAKLPIGGTVKLLYNAMATHIVPRLFLPAASGALMDCSAADELEILLSMLKASTELASSAVAASVKDNIVQSAMASFEFKGTWNERSNLVNVACDLLNTLVLKLSEVQLRQIYASLRDWRGDYDTSHPEGQAARRFAFWTVSSNLSKELRSIFLTSFTMAIDDAVVELNAAVGSFNRQRGRSGAKKQKLGNTGYGVESMRVIQPVLVTLENVLRADAHQGGNWIRSNDNQKYESILEPLGKLLLCHIPANFPGPSNTANLYQYIVEGASNGSVVGCLSALAAAGGTELHWKPLNHALLQACNDENRSDVRRAGLLGMLDLMRSLGEEYMVLLPENLPILSELLEDANDEVASLAKEAITLAEELIGENLEESMA